MRLPSPPIYRGALPALADDNLPPGYGAVPINADVSSVLKCNSK